MVVLLAFMATAVIVIWRRGRGSSQEEAIAGLNEQRRELLAQQAMLESELREATSAARIEPAAARRLGLRRASDSQMVTLLRRPRSSSEGAAPP